MTQLRDPLLEGIGVAHAFGLRDSTAPDGLVRPRQVHGVAVAVVSGGGTDPAEADAVVSDDPDCPVGIVTADCVPILAADATGTVVAAIHAGWRGLAAGVVAEGVRVLAERSGGRPLSAAIGPHIGACCYEVDGPVIASLRDRFGASLDDAVRPTRPDHWLLDLGLLVAVDLGRSGVGASNRSRARADCTFCNPARFHSYRRDAADAGRMLHHICAKRGS